jgi:hypothetical protein
MKLISHRGNIDGKYTERENHPDYIDEAILLGYDVEVDLWSIKGVLFLGHDMPQFEITQAWINERHNKLWIHCKNTEVIGLLSSVKEFNWFWHEEDTLTLTSHQYIWAYPGKQPIQNSIAVMPEIHTEEVKQCKGICSDYIKKYKL